MFFTSCEKQQLNDCFTATGEIGTEIRELEDFDRLKVGDKFKLTIVQDSSREQMLIIKGGENLFEGIKSEVKDGLLHIQNTNTCNFVRSFKKDIEIELHINDIKELMATAAVEIKSKGTLELKELHIFQQALEDINLNVDVEGELFVQSLNSGGITLSGKAFKLSGSIEEVSDLDARELMCQEVLLDTHTPLDCFIDGREIIFVKIYGSGNIFYQEEPSKQKEVNVNSGTGELLKLQ